MENVLFKTAEIKQADDTVLRYSDPSDSLQH